MPDDKQITTVTILDPQFNKENDEDKKSVLDVHAQLEDGSRINIEIQLKNKHDMEKRTLYYWSRMYASQMKEGMDYEDLCKTITINILDFVYLDSTSQYHSVFRPYERNEKFLLTDMLEIHFMELTKLYKKWRKREVDPKEDRLVRWLLLLGSSDNEELTKILEEIAMQEDQMLNKAFKEWDRVSQDPEMLLAYEARHKALLDEQSALKRAERKGKEKGRAEGKEEGKIEVAKKMLEDGISHEKVAEYTGLSLKEINKLAKSN